MRLDLPAVNFLSSYIVSRQQKKDCVEVCLWSCSLVVMLGQNIYQ